MKKFPARSGFTLVELLLIIAVIGIMVTGAIVLIDPLAQLQKASDARRKSDLSQIQKALETYYQDLTKYPDAVDYKIHRSDGAVCSGNACAAAWGTGEWAPYMSALPKDPSSSAKNYVYFSTANGQTYYIYASLDRGGNDPQACNGGSACTNVPAGASCGTGTCNYGVSTPNVSP